MTTYTLESKMNRKLKVFSLMMSAAALFLSQAALAFAEKEQDAHLVSVANVKTEQVNPTMWLLGNVISRRNSQLSAEQTGQLLWIEEVGSTVESGQVIAKIDNRHLKIQLARQDAQIEQHKADVDYLKKQQKRMLTLRETNHAAISELERTEKDLRIAENEVIALEMQMEQTLLAIEKTDIVAPFSGSVSERFANVGELITIGSPLVQLVDTHHLDIKIAAPLSIAPYLTTNANVMVKWQGKLLELPVRTWSQAGEQSSRTFDVRLSADGIDLISGTAVTVSLPKQQTKEATLVPRDALVLREKETFVLTVDEENIAQKVNVLIGQGVGQWISVSGNISSGEQVIIRGGERLQAGQKVRKDENYENHLAALN